MNRSFVSLLLATLTFVAVHADHGDAQAQAWIRDPGSAFVQLNYRLIRAERIYNPDGSVGDILPYRQHAVGLYAEAGVVDRWLMLTVDGELFRRNVLTDQAAVSGLGDIGIGAWTGLLEAPFRLSFGVHVGIPTGDETPEAPAGSDALAQTRASVLPTGDGEVDVALRLAAGHGFGWRKVQQYVLADAGYVIRTTPRSAPGGLTPGDIRDQFSWRIETGIRVDRPFIERFWFVLRVGGLLIVQDRDNTEGPARFAGLGDGVDYTSFGAEISFRMVPGWSVSFGMDGAFAARNVPAAPAWKLGLSYEIN
ncbi:MAG: hypothetical protein AB8H86_28800 [Polyangiales bacterium]